MPRITGVFIATIAGALALAGASHGEMPQNRVAPGLTGRAAVGWGVVGHNGSWLYDDGTACGAECFYSFAWERCGARGCHPIPDATNQVYKVRARDVGFRLRVIVSATKYDCGNWNYAAGTQECRWVTRAAASAETGVVAKPVRSKKRKRR